MSVEPSKISKLSIPLSIIVAGILIAGAIFFTSGKKSTVTDNQKVAEQRKSLKNINPITKNDHILGNPNAPVKIVEYSDFECPFCKRFQSTMNKIMDKYGKEGQVAWVYRHFPLDQLHPKNARVVASASECVAEQKGNNVFWQFVDAFFAATPSNDKTDLSTVLPKIYSDLGVDQTKIDKCIASGKYDKHIQNEIDNAIATGGQGTPWSIIIAKNGKTFPLSGAQPYNSVKQLIDIALGEQ